MQRGTYAAQLQLLLIPSGRPHPTQPQPAQRDTCRGRHAQRNYNNYYYYYYFYYYYYYYYYSLGARAPTNHNPHRETHAERELGFMV